jgi:two-component system sensor kinase FixL
MELGPDDMTVFADRIQAQQVIINLVRNAVEALLATDRRSIAISARQVDDLVEVSVQDNGPGIPANQRTGLFAELMTTKATGMGIGLSICRTIIEAHGGKIWLAKSSEVGTDFRFTLPTVNRRVSGTPDRRRIGAP